MESRRTVLLIEDSNESNCDKFFTSYWKFRNSIYCLILIFLIYGLMQIIKASTTNVDPLEHEKNIIKNMTHDNSDIWIPS